MIDNFALSITHLLLALAFWRLALLVDLDRDPAARTDEPEDAPGA